jgi:uracil-DNA glycosylase family protein
MSLKSISEKIASCHSCPLAHSRTRTVPGEGPEDAPAAIVGEGPGAEEDRTGRPFVGPAGRLLDSLLEQAGIPRSRLWIGNAVKCRAWDGKKDRPPTPSEIEACSRWLRLQLGTIRPAAVLLTGRTAVRAVLGEDGPVSSLRGRIHRAMDCWAVVTYHPSYALRNPSPEVRRQMLDDLDLFRRAVRAETGTAQAPWDPRALEALAAPGKRLQEPSTTPPWGHNRPAGNVPQELATALLGEPVEEPAFRLYWDVSEAHPAWTREALARFLRRNASQRGFSPGPLRGYTLSGIPCAPHSGEVLSCSLQPDVKDTARARAGTGTRGNHS